MSSAEKRKLVPSAGKLNWCQGRENVHWCRGREKCALVTRAGKLSWCQGREKCALVSRAGKLSWCQGREKTCTGAKGGKNVHWCQGRRETTLVPRSGKMYTGAKDEKCALVPRAGNTKLVPMAGKLEHTRQLQVNIGFV